MSRLGKTPIPLPKEVEIKGLKDLIEIKGPKGTVKVNLPKGIFIKVSDSQVLVEFDASSSLPKPMYGLYRSILSNHIIGVSTGFEKQLSLIGVGYRAAVKGEVLDLQLGFSHPSQLQIPSEVQISVEKNTLIKITGIDKQVVGQFAANIRAIRPPEPYKGKGVRYVDEFVRKKAGKAAKGK